MALPASNHTALPTRRAWQSAKVYRAHWLLSILIRLRLGPLNQRAERFTQSFSLSVCAHGSGLICGVFNVLLITQFTEKLRHTSHTSKSIACDTAITLHRTDERCVVRAPHKPLADALVFNAAAASQLKPTEQHQTRRVLIKFWLFPISIHQAPATARWIK